MIFRISLLLLVVSSVFFGCKKQIINDPDSADQMVLVYIAANNDLWLEAINSVNELERGYSGKNSLLVFIKTESERSYLLKIKPDNTARIVSDTVATYGSENSSDPRFMSRVIADARSISPASTYGLVLWSHASSWVPPRDISLKSFGEDRGVEMDLIELKNALPTDFKYIIFDACSMASIEAIYELRNNAKYILASPTEVLSTSYPYEDIVPYLFGGVDELKLIGQKFIDYYKSLPGNHASATVSLVDTRSLDLLAVRTKELFSTKMPNEGFDKTTIQRLDFDPVARVPAYDFLDFLKHGFDAEDYALVKEQLDKTILYKNNTSNFLSHPIITFNGISTYLPEEQDPFQFYYSKLEWYSDGGMYNLFQ